jgi:light-independent protochlorophyllide reductase subunit N
VRVLNYSGSGIETTFTQGEDACLAALVPSCRRPPPTHRRSLLVVGCLPTWSKTSSAACSSETGHRPVRFFPPRRAELPAVGPNTPFPAGAALPGRHRARARGARRHACCRHPSRFGAEGTTAWLQAAATAFGMSRRTSMR